MSNIKIVIVQKSSQLANQNILEMAQYQKRTYDPASNF